jgi:5-formyltetrahydrofolate cyclo-ligase
MDHINLAKRTMRDQIRARLAELTPQEIHDLSEHACTRLIASEAFRHAETVLLFMPLPREVDLSHIALRCFQDNRTICLPKIDWDHQRMWPVAMQSFDEHALVPDRYGLRVPERGAPIPLEMIDMVLVPGLAFDAEGNRLGRGGGYYDRFLSQPAFVGRSVGMGFDCQVVDRVPTAAHDVPVDMVITDRRVIAPDRARRGT